MKKNQKEAYLTGLLINVLNKLGLGYASLEILDTFVTTGEISHLLLKEKIGLDEKKMMVVIELLCELIEHLWNDFDYSIQMLVTSFYLAIEAKGGKYCQVICEIRTDYDAAITNHIIARAAPYINFSSTEKLYEKLPVKNVC